MRFRAVLSRPTALALTVGAACPLAALAVTAEGCGQGFNLGSGQGDAATGSDATLATNDGASSMMQPGDDASDDGAAVVFGDDGPVITQTDGAPPDLDAPLADPFMTFSAFANNCSTLGAPTNATCVFAFEPSLSAKITRMVYGPDAVYIGFTASQVASEPGTFVGRISLADGTLKAIPMPNFQNLARNEGQIYWLAEAPIDAGAMGSGYTVYRYDIASNEITAPITFDAGTINYGAIRAKGTGIAAYSVSAVSSTLFAVQEVDTQSAYGIGGSAFTRCTGMFRPGNTDFTIHPDSHGAYVTGLELDGGNSSHLLDCPDDGGPFTLDDPNSRPVYLVPVNEATNGASTYVTFTVGSGANALLRVQGFHTDQNAGAAGGTGTFVTTLALGSPYGAELVNLSAPYNDQLYILTTSTLYAVSAPPTNGTLAPRTVISGFTGGSALAVPPGTGIGGNTYMYFAAGGSVFKNELVP